MSRIGVAWLLGTGLLPTGCAPAAPAKDPATNRYIANAQDSRDYLNNHPIAQLLSMLLVHRTAVTNLRRVPNSCEGGTDASIRQMTDVVATVTDYGFGVIPMARYETSCAGLSITRGRISPAAPADAPSRNPSSTVPPPRPPPPPAA